MRLTWGITTGSLQGQTVRTRKALTHPALQQDEQPKGRPAPGQPVVTGLATLLDLALYRLVTSTIADDLGIP